MFDEIMVTTSLSMIMWRDDAPINASVARMPGAEDVTWYCIYNHNMLQ